jgi:uncharacterized protein YdaU (DUF1376 family)
VNYYERFSGDYSRDTAHLSLAEHGAYTLLLDTYYATERALPASLEALARICRAMTNEERASVEAVANQFFPVGTDGQRHNARADIEISKARLRIENARINGRSGGRPPKPDGLPDENPTGNPAITQSESSPDPRPQRSVSSLRSETAPRFVAPGWLPQPAWQEFDEMRRASSGKAWTDAAKRGAVRELEKLVAAGENGEAVLRQSVVRSWKGLFPVDARKSTVHDKRSATARAMYGDRLAKPDDAIDGTAERIA